MFTIDKNTMHQAVAGACVLASGGGGSYQVAQKIIDEGIGPDDFAEVVTLDDIGANPQGWLAACANMGAPDALFKTTNPHAPTNAFRSMQKELWGQRSIMPRFAHFPDEGFSWVLPIEVGAINAASPLAVAVQMSRSQGRMLGIIDADGAGRSIPTLSLTVFAANHMPIVPTVVASEGGTAGGLADGPGGYQSACLWVHGEEAAEQAVIGTVMTEPFGGIAGMTTYPLTAGELLKATPPVPGTLTLAIQIGDILHRYQGLQRAEQVASCIRAAGRPSGIIWHGMVTRVVQAEGGVDVGRIELADASGTNTTMTIYNENENVYAMRSDQDFPCVLGPDSICYVTTGYEPLAIDNSDLNRMYLANPDTRLELYILAVQAAPQMQNQVIIDNFAAVNRSLGYGGRYRPWPAVQEDQG